MSPLALKRDVTISSNAGLFLINFFNSTSSKSAKEAYEWAIENGIAKEQARAVLPEGLTMSRMYMNGTLRSWVHYIDLRSANGTQKEHQEIAVACALEIAKIFPLMSEL